jgi:dTDP-4-dehydrorhamnose reductase
MTPGMCLLTTGGSSYLGQHLVRRAASLLDGITGYTFFSHDPLLALSAVRYRSALNVCDEEAVRRCINGFRPDVVIHTAGSNRSPDMERVIVEGTGHVASATAAIGARLIHLSTDSVFDGTAAPYDEAAAPTPVNAYGRAKAAAEEIVRAHPNHVIVRTSLIYGLEQMDNGTAWMAEALRAGRPVTLFTNQVRNPIWAESLSQACLELAHNNYVGVLNVAGQQALTRAEFALKLLDWWGVAERETLTLGTAEDGRWPLDCTLDLRLASGLLTTQLLGVDEVIRDRTLKHHVWRTERTN